MKTCKECMHFIGMGDWNLCCDIEHPTPKEKEQGQLFLFGHLCYEDTEACDMFEEEIMARWKGAGMGDYYCSYCQERVSGNRRLRCPNCNARMYTNEEYNRMVKEWELEDELYDL